MSEYSCDYYDAMTKSICDAVLHLKLYVLENGTPKVRCPIHRHTIAFGFHPHQEVSQEEYLVAKVLHE